MRGRSLLHYEMLSRLGAGGMGEVWRAHDARLDREVAIKILSTESGGSSQSRERLVREARAACSLIHPNIITIHEINSADGIDFIVMEYVKGETLAAEIARGRLPPARAVEYTIQICAALETAHQAGVVHRDLKPGNIMITSGGSLKVLDFGIAKRLPDPGSGSDKTTAATLTAAGVVIGTPAYMSPEQTLGDAVGPRSDLFSLGVVLYEMLTGSQPFRASTTLSLVRQIVHEAPPPLRDKAPEVPEGLARIVDRCLAKEPTARYPDASTLAHELRLVRANRRRFRSRRFVWLAAALIVVLGVAWRGSGLKTWTASLFAPATLTDEQAPPTELYRRASEALRVYYRDGNANLDKAIAQLELALQKKPEYPQAQARLSLAYLRKNSLNRDAEWRKRALAHADAAVAGNSQLALAHLAQGAARAANAELDKAAESYDRAAILDPANSELLWRQGDLAATRKDQVKAEEYFRRAVIAAPDDWEAHVRRGAFLYRMARYEEAVKEFEIARDGAPDHTRVYASLAGVYHQLGRTDEAAAALQRSLDIAEDDITYSNLGTLLYFQGKYDDAERAFDQAVRLGANNYQRWGNLADAVRMTAPGSQKMHDSYRRAIQLARTVMGTLVATTAAETRSSMAVYLARDGQLPAAAAELDTLLGEKQLLAATLHNAALVAELTNQRAKALNLIERALVAGYQLQEIKQEPDFVKLRTDPAYHLLASKYEK